MTASPNNHQPNEAAEIRQCFTNPTARMADAWFYAGITGQAAEYAEIKAAMDEIYPLLQAFEADTGIPMFDEQGQRGIQRGIDYAEANAATDARLKKVAELAKTRFLVTVLDHGANMKMAEHSIEQGCPGHHALEKAAAAIRH